MSDKEYLENIIKTCLKESVDEYLDTDYEGYKKISNDTANDFWRWYSKNSNPYEYGISPGSGDAPTSNNMIVYHSCKPSALSGLIKNGFSREFTADNGNCYGSGVYTTLTPTNQTDYYGASIVKCILVDGLKDFIIFPKDLRDKFHGRGISLQQEIENVIGKDPEAMAEIKRRTSYDRYTEHGDNAHHFSRNTTGNRIQDENGLYTRQYDEHLLNKAGVRGFVYRDGHGIVVLVRDFNSLIPYQVVKNRRTFDLSTWGRNWEYMMDNEDDFNNVNNNTDVYYSFSGKYPKTHPYETQRFGYARVRDNNGFNYANVRTKEEVLPVAAKQALPFGPDKKATFMIDGIEHQARIMPNGDVKLFWRGSGFPLSKEMFARKLEMDKNNR